MILLDTHTLLWVVTGRRKIGRSALRSIRTADRVLASAISHVEIRLKNQRGKLNVPDDLSQLIYDQGIHPLPFTEEHATGLALVPALEGHDPFDRMLMAQAVVERLSLVTADSALLDLDLPWVIDATE